jgi:hypothetical protein
MFMSWFSHNDICYDPFVTHFKSSLISVFTDWNQRQVDCGNLSFRFSLFKNLSSCLLTFHQPSSVPCVHCHYKSSPYLHFPVILLFDLSVAYAKSSFLFWTFVSLFLIMSISSIKALGFPSHVCDAWSHFFVMLGHAFL